MSRIYRAIDNSGSGVILATMFIGAALVAAMLVGIVDWLSMQTPFIVSW